MNPPSDVPAQERDAQQAMSSPINIHVYSDALVLLGTAGVVIPLARRFGLNPILGYLGAGAILGPLGLGSFIENFPLLYWFTVVDAQNVSGIAHLGIVFLLFLLGMELSGLTLGLFGFGRIGRAVARRSSNTCSSRAPIRGNVVFDPSPTAN